MTDVRELLHGAVPDGVFELEGDFGRVVRRGEHLRRRSMALRLGAIPAGLVVVALLAVSALNGTNQAVRILGTPSGPDETTTTAPSARAGATATSVAAKAPTVTVPVTSPVTTPLTDNTRPPAGDEPMPAATAPPPSGYRIAVSRTVQQTTPNGSQSSTHIYTLNPDGSDARQLFSNVIPLLSWSADHRSFLTSTQTSDGRTHLLTLDVQTGATHEVAVNNDGYGFSGSFSPDGRSVVYQQTDHQDVQIPDEQTSHVWVADVDGSHARELVAGGTPAWSPDGSTIAFIDSRTTSVALMSPDGTNVRTLPAAATGGSALAWSPDGAWIAGIDQNLRLFVVHPDGSGLHNIGVGHAQYVGVGWSGDSSRVVYNHLAMHTDITGRCTSPPCEDTVSNTGLWAAAVNGSSDAPIPGAEYDYDPITPVR